MTAPMDIGMMDFLLQRDDFKMSDHNLFNNNHINIKNEIDLDISGFTCSNTGDNFINDVWSSNPDEILDSILNDGGQLEGVLDPSPNSCSDSGLSSENHDMLEQQSEFEETFHIGDEDEIINSSVTSSPGPSISETGVQSSPQYSAYHHYSEGGSSNSSVVYEVSPPIQDDQEDITEMIYEPLEEDTSNVTSPVISIQQPTILNQQQRVLSSNNNKSQTVRIVNQKNGNNKLSGKVIRIQSITGSNGAQHPRSILLPVSVKDLRKIKIINAPNNGGVTLINNKKYINKLNTASNLIHSNNRISIKNNNIVFKQATAVSPATSNDDMITNDTIDITCNSPSEDDDIFDGSSNSETASSIVNNQDNHGNGTYPRLQLTTEEQRLLAKEGISLPTSYPLTKHEERELKRIRRKIRNKISAQDSRKRKKEYVDGLEDRVKQCTEENQTLLKRIKVLQTQNQTLVSQLRRLQALVTRKIGGGNATRSTGNNTNTTTSSLNGGFGTNNKAQPATCLMVLLLSLALIAVPSLKQHQHDDGSSLSSSDIDSLESKVEEYIGKRALLFKPALDDGGIDDDLSMDDLITFHHPTDNYSSAVPSKRIRLEPQLAPLEELSLDGYPPTTDPNNPKIQSDDVLMQDATLQKHERNKFMIDSSASLLFNDNDELGRGHGPGGHMNASLQNKNNIVILQQRVTHTPEDK